MCACNINIKQREGNSITLNLLGLYAKRVLAYPFQVNDIHSVILHTNIFDAACRKSCYISTPSFQGQRNARQSDNLLQSDDASLYQNMEHRLGLQNLYDFVGNIP
jgi:hypothetical protein